ncbi:hypothetical protein EII29_09715 [Leptotrichia sp. OH3620_COT-345]|uniref:hypothetical protein n=1 Tax=Leptotrichia sp. OH3620_COT-345 TaxID=2491048 RepID=UPI000F645BE4|nr:hypothetical protein [Leptotrichia sp. OH3620_COT-345]RRD38792.1 hypothetical protein EII29_09715 [Leptotrichia sp. OH3620_COT-345]
MRKKILPKVAVKGYPYIYYCGTFLPLKARPQSNTLAGSLKYCFQGGKIFIFKVEYDKIYLHGYFKIFYSYAF